MTAYQLSQAAEHDYVQIMRTSLRDFGRPASIRYKELMSQAIRQLTQDPERHGSRAFEKGVRPLSFEARRKRRPNRRNHRA
jgi:plasmid stabilization system protein ParE